MYTSGTIVLLFAVGLGAPPTTLVDAVSPQVETSACDPSDTSSSLSCVPQGTCLLQSKTNVARKHITGGLRAGVRKVSPQEAKTEQAVEMTLEAAVEQIDKLSEQVHNQAGKKTRKIHKPENSPLGNLKRCRHVQTAEGHVWTEVFTDLQPPLRLVLEVTAPEAHVFLGDRDLPRTDPRSAGWLEGDGYQVTFPGDEERWGMNATRVCRGFGLSRCREGDGPFHAEVAYPTEAHRVGSNQTAPVKFLITTDYVFGKKLAARQAILSASEYHGKTKTSLLKSVSLERGNLTEISVMSRNGPGTWRICEAENIEARKELAEKRTAERKALAKYVAGGKEITVLPAAGEEAAANEEAAAGAKSDASLPKAPVVDDPTVTKAVEDKPAHVR